MPDNPRRSRGRIALAVVSIALFLLAAAILVAMVFFPTQTERLVGEAKVEVEKAAAAASNQTPTITLGPEGGTRALDDAESGTFIEMVGYRMEGVPSVYAAHNNRGGDIILGWELNQTVHVVDSTTGTEGDYIVVEERFTKKWSNIDELVGMRGPITVQTCYYGEDRMRFLSLVPVAEWEAEQETSASP